jgi:hypothetical protein
MRTSKKFELSAKGFTVCVSIHGDDAHVTLVNPQTDQISIGAIEDVEALKHCIDQTLVELYR